MSTLSDLTEEFLLYLETVRGLSKNTVLSYKNDLGQLLLMPSIVPKIATPEKITSEDLRLCIGVLSKKKRSASSINRFISSFRTFFSYLRKFGQLEINSASEIKTVKMPKVLPHFMTGAEVDKMCAAPEKKELLWQSRDTAILEMLYSSGCRISELQALKFEDFTSDFSKAVVHGKGGKDRFVYFESKAREALKKYLEERTSRFDNENFPGGKLKNAECKNIFVNQNCAPLTVRGIRWIIARYSGVEGTNRHVAPHDFRHTFATSMLTNGADVRVVQEMLGHSSISTTQRYTHITTDALIDSYNKAHPHGSHGSGKNGKM